jgi:hypothetical protein
MRAIRPAHVPLAALAALAAAAVGCVHVAPPASAPPTADDALARMHASLACGRAVQATAKIDHFGEQGRVRGDVMLFAAQPASVRLDVISPFGVALATLTSDGTRFALADLRDKRFYFGPASACNIARLTTVPVPGRVLVDLLRGEAPVLVHSGAPATLAWSAEGYWVVRVDGTRDAHEEIHLAPRPGDFGLPWDRQRLRVLDVRVTQQGYVLYHAELRDHAPAATAGPRIDPDNLEPPLPPSGPPCDAEIPRRIHVEVPDPEADVRFVYGDLKWNPPLPQGTFEQAPIAGLTPTPVTCE